MAIRMLSLLAVTAAMLVAPQLVRAEVFEGTIVNLSENEVVLMVAEEEMSFTITEDTNITLDGVAIDELDDLGMGATANITAEKQEDDSWVAVSIMAQTTPLVRQE